ncbi:hypothetical protein HK099_004021 [Clydaea vesicula]|uniref:Uncharacterized protein n=1 Tax=Clydaea vesicula TaxID=447962 RepID=A0AAD5XVX4_9FUNG|nr:hypothetical protein HK099_004021 [Clydaea vesicula]
MGKCQCYCCDARNCSAVLVGSFSATYQFECMSSSCMAKFSSCSVPNDVNVNGKVQANFVGSTEYFYISWPFMFVISGAVILLLCSITACIKSKTRQNQLLVQTITPEMTPEMTYPPPNYYYSGQQRYNQPYRDPFNNNMPNRAAGPADEHNACQYQTGGQNYFQTGRLNGGTC